MKFKWAMPQPLRPYYHHELSNYQQYLLKGDFINAWPYLERAHILGQSYPVEHTAVHFRMLLFGFKTRNLKEIIGQIPRLLVGGIKSWAGIIPLGNTGGANVKAWKPMPIPSDLQQILSNATTNN